MWRTLIAFFAHRILLFGAILFGINQSADVNGGGSGFRLAPTPVLIKSLEKKVGETEEAVFLDSIPSNSLGVVFQHTKNPMYVLIHAIKINTGLSTAWVLILVSSLFFLFFLSELYTLVSRMQTSDIAAATADLALLWPTSYELNLGSTLALTCFLTTFVVRKALDDRWLQCGIAIGLLALAEPLALLLVPLCLYFFWFYQRYYLVPQRIQRAIFFLAPLVAAIAWRYTTEGSFFGPLQDSALLNLWDGIQKGTEGLRWTFGRSVLGQSLIVAVFVIGAVIVAITNQAGIHRILALYMVGVWLATSAYANLASRCLLAGLALQGVASASSRAMLRILKVGLLIAGLYEAFVVMQI